MGKSLGLEIRTQIKRNAFGLKLRNKWSSQSSLNIHWIPAGLNRFWVVLSQHDLCRTDATSHEGKSKSSSVMSQRAATVCAFWRNYYVNKHSHTEAVHLLLLKAFDKAYFIISQFFFTVTCYKQNGLWKYVKPVSILILCILLESKSIYVQWDLFPSKYAYDCIVES